MKPQDKPPANFPKNTYFIFKFCRQLWVRKNKSHAHWIRSSLGRERVGKDWAERKLEDRDCVCPGEGQLVSGLGGYLRHLPKLPAKTIIMKNRRWNLLTPVKVYANPKNQTPAHLLWYHSQNFFGQLMKIKILWESTKIRPKNMYKSFIWWCLLQLLKYKGGYSEFEA